MFLSVRSWAAGRQRWRIWTLIAAQSVDFSLGIPFQPAASLRLYSADSRVVFRKAGPWEQIRSALLVLKTDIRMREVADAMNALKSKSTDVPQSFLIEIRDVVLEHLEQLEPPEACDILHSCVKLAFLDPALCGGITKRLAEASSQLNQLDNRGLATLIYSLSQVKRLGAAVECIPDETLSALMQKMAIELRCDSREIGEDSRLLVSSLYAMGQLRYKDDASLVSDLAGIALQPEVLHTLNEQEFSMLVTALHELTFPCTPEQWTAIKEELDKEPRRTDLSRKGLTNVLRRLAIMEFPYREVLIALARESVRPHRLRSYNGQDLANLIHTIAVQCLDPQENLECFEAKVVEPVVLSNLKQMEICNVIYGFALLKNTNKAPLFRALGREAVRQGRLQRYTGQGLSVLIYSFGLVKFEDLAVLKPLAEECRKAERLKEFSEQALSNIVYGLGRLRIAHPVLRSAASALLEEATQSQRLKAFTEQALANLVYSLSQLQMPEHLEPLVSEICTTQRLMQINDQGLSNTLQSLSRLQYDKATGVRVLLTEAAKRSRQGELSEIATSNILSAITGLGIKDRSLLKPFLRKSEKSEAAKQASTELLISVLERYNRLEIRDYVLINPLFAEIGRTERLKEMSTGALVQSLKLMWQFGMTSCKAISSLANELKLSESRYGEPKEIAAAATALGWLKYPDRELMRQLCQVLMEDSALQRLEVQEIVQLLQSLQPSALGAESIEPFVTHLSRTELLRQLDIHQLTDLLQFHVTFGLRDEARLQLILKEMTRKKRTAQLCLKDGALALESLISMGLQEIEGAEKLVKCMGDPALLEQCRVHYVAKMVVCLCRLGRAHKRQATALVDHILQPPWSEEITEKDLSDVLKAVIDVDYEYGKLGGLLNRRRRDVKRSLFFTAD